ncbi:MAG: TonB-dependent receptor [Ignavibacteriaceae bacterium]|nr:TonB-dependent receptor [Ignavibacteriaceae bacterium]
MKYILFFILFTGITFAQFGNISGEVTDENGLPVTGARASLTELNTNATSNLRGVFTFSGVPLQDYTIIITSLGYHPDTVRVKISDIESGKIHQVRLVSVEVVTAPVMVSAMKYKHAIDALPYATELLSHSYLNARTVQSVDDVLRSVPGVNITLDQVSIRGSSGYSRGAGTRVMTALDGIPLYTGDTGEIIWEMIPFYDLENVEIVKGPASSLYGSTAIGGVINMQTRDITTEGLTILKTFYGLYDKPSHSQWDWSGQYRAFSGVTVSHSNSIPNFGYSVSLKNQTSQGYRLDDYYKRLTGYFKVKYNFSEYTNMSFFSSSLDQYRGNFIYWKDSRNALVPREEDRDQRVNSFRSINALLFDSQLSSSLFLGFRSSHYHTDWRDESVSANRSVSNLLRNEVFLASDLGEEIKILSGAEILTGVVRSNIFSNPTSTGIGAYSQVEYKGISDLTSVAGLRYDRNKASGLDVVDNISPRIGINYKQDQSIYYRLNAGTAFRAPTLAEIYTTTNASGVVIKANPGLKPEKSASYEAGILFRPNNILEFDLSIYRNDYEGLIEPEVDLTDGKVRLNNVAEARIIGADIVVKGRYLLDRVTYTLGYTWLDTKDITRNKELKYRPKHLVNFNLRFKYGNFELHLDSRFASKVKEIDNELIELGIVKEGDKRVPVVVSNAGLNYTILKWEVPVRLNLTVNNIFNYNYVEIIGNLAPIRNISLGVELLY